MVAGITNHDEYSLVRESAEDEVENKPNYGTLTLKRKKEEKERDVKMEQLRKKLKTDDEGTISSAICFTWGNHTRVNTDCQGNSKLQTATYSNIAEV